MTKQKKSSMKLHPIQLVSLGVKELSIIANEPPDLSVGVDVGEGGVCSIMFGHSDYDTEDNTINIFVKLEVGQNNEEKSPFSMKVELVGTFRVDEAQFKIEYIDDWAHRNAPFIMMPYLREHAFGLTQKCGFRPIILPLTEVPVFKISKSD